MFMTPLLAEFTAWHYLYTIGLSSISIFLILVILVQRGRGGGLTGALGGMGGQSAFGTKAGDLFTKITIAVAIVWALSTMLIIYYVGGQAHTGGLGSERTDSGAAVTTEKKGDEKKGAEGKEKTPAAKTPETKTTPSKTPAKSDDKK